MEIFETGHPMAEAVERKTEMFYPLVLLFAFIICAGVRSISTSRTEEELVTPVATGPGGKPLPLTKRKREHEEVSLPEVDYFSGGAKRAFQYLTATIVLTFIANAVAVAVHALRDRAGSDGGEGWWCGESRTVYIVGSAFLYIYILITLFDSEDSPNVVHFIVWVLALLGEITITTSSSIRIAGGPYTTGATRLSGSEEISDAEAWEYINISLATLRLSLVTGLVCLYATLAWTTHLRRKQLLEEESRASEADEQSPLLNGDGRDYHTNSNGHATAGRTADGRGSNTAARVPERDQDAAFYRQDKLPHKTWFEYCRGYSIFFPYLWPSNSTRLQGVVLICFIFVIAQRVLNILVPLQTGAVTDSFIDGDGNRHMPWFQLSMLIGFKLLQGPSGMLGSMRSVLWIPVSQHTYRALTTAAFEHVHSLSLDFHLGKRTGEVLSALNKGASINQFLEQVTFQVIPMLADLLIAIVFFYWEFGSMYALFVSIITFYYLYLTIRMAATRADQRRDMVNADREEEAVKNDSITSYETVKYFNAEQFEFNRYDNAIKKFQVAEAQVTWGLNQMNMCQAVVFMTGILVAMMTCAFEVSQGTRTVGQFVLLVTYLGQLQGPLNFFGTFYRTVQQAMISGERLLELFKIQPTVIDAPGVKPLLKCNGHIRWDNVRFSYDHRRTALRNLSFECIPGTTTAFVGESGGGKSTVFRLMFRYYNSEEGSVQIDGHDVKDLTIDSVRRFIGVVPQDTMLFNETLMYNLKYANPSATEEEVFDACRAAAIHDRIMTFPDGYDTKVGERGLRLSGGEKQRVAIARTFLKNPRIIMLDEATSALDGETEQKIQSKLISGNFGQDRTLLIIAHRLSTITHADQIVVLHNGMIAEKGTHDELLALNGRYKKMWEKHCRAERAAEEARVATTKANKLLRQANIPGGEQAGYSSDGYNSLASSAILKTGASTPGALPSQDNMSIASSQDTSSDDTSSDDSHSPQGSDFGDVNELPVQNNQESTRPANPT